MNDNDYKKIADLVDDRINTTFDPIKNDLTELKQDLKGVKSDLKGVKSDVEEVKETLQSHTGALIRIESVLDGYADSYKINKHNIQRLNTRLSTVEGKLNIEIPEDLKVPHFADLPH